MRTKRLEAMTIRELMAEYNSHGPRRPLKTWKGKKYDLFLTVLTAEKQKWYSEGVTLISRGCDAPMPGRRIGNVEVEKV